MENYIYWKDYKSIVFKKTKIFCESCCSVRRISHFHKGTNVCVYCEVKLKKFGNNVINSKEIIPIDVDLIHNLKLRNLHREANESLLAFRKSISKEKEQILQEIKQRDKQIKKVAGICSACLKPAIKNRAICKSCFTSRLKSQKKYNTKK